MSDPVETPDTGAAQEAANTDQEQTQPEAANQNQETPAQTRRRIQLKIDGRDEEREVSDDDLIAGYRKSLAAEKRFNEAAAQRKQAQEVLEAFKANPREAMALLGINAREWAENMLAEELEQEMLDPREKEFRAMKAKLAKVEAQEKADRERQEKQALQQQIEAEKENFSQIIVGALQEQGVPGGPKTVARMAQLLEKNYELGLDLQPRELAMLVRQEVQAELMATLGALDEDSLLKVLPEEFFGKVNKAALKKLQPKTPAAQSQKPAQSSRKSKPETKAELEARLARIARGEED